MKMGYGFFTAGLFALVMLGLQSASALQSITVTVPPLAPFDLTATNVPAPVGLVGWWKGEDNAANAAGPDPGVLVGNVTFTNGVVGDAFSLNGAGACVLVTNSPTFSSLTNAISVEAWVKSATLGVNPEWAGIVTKGNSSWRLQATSQSKGVYWAITGVVPADLTGTRDVNDGQWHHVVATYDGAKMSLYVDGALDVSQDATGTIPQDDQPVYIGANSGAYVAPGSQGLGYFFNGQVDEPSIYRRGLSADEVLALFNAGSLGKVIPTNVPPWFVTQPQSRVVPAGGAVEFSAEATGYGFLSYQWFFNGAKISGAAGSILALTNLHVNQSGNYQVVVSNVSGSVTSAVATLTVIPQDILVYTYSGNEKITTLNYESTISYQGRMYFLPDTTNGVFVGWATIGGKKQYWVSPFSKYIWYTIPGKPGHVITVLGYAGSGFDDDGAPRFYSYLHRGQNSTLTISSQKKMSFPSVFNCNNNVIYPDANTGSLILREAVSSYLFSSSGTQVANNLGQTTADLLKALTTSLETQGYTRQ